MYTLALDTSTSQGGLAVLKGTDVLSRRLWLREKSHSEMLTPTLEACLAEAGIRAAQLARIAVGQGPGSFTGIRIAINAARTLSFSLSLPVHAFDTLRILAAGVPASERPVLALVNAHKNLLYTARFVSREGTWMALDVPTARSLEEIEQLIQTPHVCIGDAYVEYESILPSSLKANLLRDAGLSDFPLPEVLGNLALTDPHRPLEWNEVQALYIRASEAEERLRQGL
jgi:tRNA threonylcarbamoyladenosine biosynthesis protein TsaB